MKGLFAIYHLTREHKWQHRELPSYLYAFALEFAVPIIPTAEGLYERHFGEPQSEACRDIPDDLLELGRGTVDNFTVCLHHARQMHRLLEALATDGREALSIMFRICGVRKKIDMGGWSHRWSGVPATVHRAPTPQAGVTQHESFPRPDSTTRRSMMSE